MVQFLGPITHADAAFDDGHSDTAPVGSYPARASWCSALDMVGNVWEWTKDWYGYYASEENPSWLASDQTDRVIRGGAWDTERGHARGTFRNWFNPAKSHDSIGFRCVVPLQPLGQLSGQVAVQPSVQATPTAPAATLTPADGMSVADVVANLQELPLDDFFGESYKQLLLRNPEKLTELGVAKSYGLGNDRLNNMSDAYIRET